MTDPAGSHSPNRLHATVPMSGYTPAYTPPTSESGLEESLREALAPNLLLVRHLGSGGMASVFLAREPILKRLVAVKVMQRELAAHEQGRSRFEREAQAVASLSHPNIVAVHSFGVLRDGSSYFVMQFVEGQSLATRLEQEGPLTLPEARRILGQVAWALSAAHKRGIVHRDIKPANILHEDSTGRVLVSDFGIAAMLADAEGADAPVRLTSSGMIIGTPQYMSPEQLLSEPVTEKTDVYSLGLLAHELLIGSGPFRASSPHELIAAHLRDTPPRLSERRADIDPEFDEFIARCLQKNAALRPSAADVAGRLGAGGTPLLEWPPPGLEKLTGKLSALSRLYWWGDGLLAIAVLASVLAAPSMAGSLPALMVLVVASAAIWILVAASRRTLAIAVHVTRAVRSGYGWLTVLEVLSDRRGDTGSVVTASKEYATLTSTECNQVRRTRVSTEVTRLVSGASLTALLPISVALASNHLASSWVIAVILALPIVAAVAATNIALLSEERFASARRRMVAGSRHAAPRLAPSWYERFESARQGQGLGRGWLRGAATGRLAAITLSVALWLGIIALVPLLIVGVLGPRLVWDRNTDRMRTNLTLYRMHVLPRDTAIPAVVAGRALAALKWSGRPTSSDSNTLSIPQLPAIPWDWRDVPLDLFVGARGRGGPPQHVRNLDVDRLLRQGRAGFSPVELRYLETIVRAPHWSMFDTLARARRIDIVGALLRDTLHAQLPWWRYTGELYSPAIQQLRWAIDARAAYYLSIGRPDSAEFVYRQAISVAVALIEYGTADQDLVYGRFFAYDGYKGLKALFQITSNRRPREMLALEQAVSSTAAGVAPGTATGDVVPVPTSASIRSSRIAAALDVSDYRANRLAHLSYLATTPCMNVSELVYGHHTDVRQAFDEARRGWARFESDTVLLSIMLQTAERTRFSTADDLALPEPRWLVRAAYAIGWVSGAILRNPRIAGCSMLLMSNIRIG